MDKSLKIAKMNVIDILKATGVFYCILLITLAALFAINANGSVSGLEVASIIFIFVCGLNSFKENFYFSQGNNISRKSFIGGVILSAFPIAIIMAIIDLLINRVMNLFIPSPSLYDMGYTALKNFDNGALHTEWIQSNGFTTVINTILLSFVLYCFAYILGIVINLIYYRCNTLMKIAVSVIGGGILITWLSSDLNYGLFKVLERVLGIKTQNVYLAILSCILMFIVLSGCIYRLIKTAEIKER